MTRIARAAGLAVLLGAATGCNLIFGVGDPVLVEGSGGGTTATTVGSGGAGGTGGGTPSCVGVVCDDGNVCTADFCDAQGACSARPNDEAMPEQLPGDCVDRTCTGGALALVANDDDLPPSDGNPCTVEKCDAGEPVHGPEAMGTPCNGNGTCDGSGLCSTCTTAAQCGIDTECATFSCNGQCGVVYAPPTTVLPQTAGDCSRKACTGMSAVPADLPDDADLEDDSNECTKDACDAGSPRHDPFPAGTPCGTDGTGVCSGTGFCGRCITMDDCAGNIDGEICLETTWACGCKTDVECRSKFGHTCLASQICGCNSDLDCKFVGAVGPYCNPVLHKCSPNVIEPG